MKRLIEVAPFLPLDAISTAAKADKDKKTGTIKNVHKWFAPMPSPAMRALIFATAVNAPEDEAERRQLLELIRRLVPADGGLPSEDDLSAAREAIRRSQGDSPPVIFDPFCGGGSTLVEAQRLGLNASGSDLNPVPVLISRTLVELLPQVSNRQPITADPSQLARLAGGPLDGFLTDVRFYARSIRDRVWAKVGALYPPGPNGYTVMAWFWAWSVVCPNPACLTQIPLYTSPWLGKAPGAERWLRPVVTDGTVLFELGEGLGPPPPPTKVGQARFRCLRCSHVPPARYIHEQIDQHKGRHILLGAVATTHAGKRIFLAAREVEVPSVEPPDNASSARSRGTFGSNAQGRRYGFERIVDHFTNRQQTTLSAFAEAIADTREMILADGATDIYADAIMSMLGLAIGRLAQANNMQVRWKIDSRNGSASAQAAFGTHAVQMVWDFTEANPFGGSVGDWIEQLDGMFRGLQSLPLGPTAHVMQGDARTVQPPPSSIIITDPPYFDQIAYADLSDHMYVWIREALGGNTFPELFGTIETPKSTELIAAEHRHDGAAAAYEFFVDGFTDAFRHLGERASPDAPMVVVYAHRQEERSTHGSASTGWDAMLEAILRAGLVIEGTLPIRGTSSSRQISQDTNALASYIAMVCRPRTSASRPGTIGEFRADLRRRLPHSAAALLASGESMVDVRQAAIGPGIEVFCQFRQVFDGDEAISVRRALSIINSELGRLLDENLGEVDDATRWACQWFADHGFVAGGYDEGRKLAAVYGLGLDRLSADGIIEQGRGKVRLISRDQRREDWIGGLGTPVWEACQHLTKRLGDGETACAQLLARFLFSAIHHRRMTVM